ncbi:MAG: RNA repair transcriptional activator RtcR [Steroidobacter sp.]
MKTVVIGFLGSVLDSGSGAGRWEKWRPSISICQHEDLVVDRFEMLHARSHLRLAEQLRTDISAVSPETKMNLHECDPADPWDFQEVYNCLYEFARQYRFDPERERYLIHITTGTHVAQICMFLLTEARYFPAVLLQTSPPRKQGSQAVGAYSLIDLDLSRYNQIGARFAREQQESTEFLKSGIKTRNAAFNQMIARIEQVAVRSKAPLMLNGPTGAGKSTLARRIYELKKSRHKIQGEFVEVNCATLRGDSALSTLFGHVKGAFTGAQSDRAGLLRKAHGGVVFLDEIGELGLDEQTMLLKAIEEKRFAPMGSDKEVESDFQLIAGTNRDLRVAVEAGRFRDDLLARINLWVFELPAVRERREDIEPNIDYELERYARENDLNVRFNAEARREYQRFAGSPAAVWNGNFRELSASIMRMATLAEGGRITVDVVQDEIERLKSAWRPKQEHSNLESLLPAAALANLDLFDRLQLDAVVATCRSCATMAEAGRKLFAASRTRRRAVNDSDRLKKYLARFDLDWAALKQ